MITLTLWIILIIWWTCKTRVRGEPENSAQGHNVSLSRVANQTSRVLSAPTATPATAPLTTTSSFSQKFITDTCTSCRCTYIQRLLSSSSIAILFVGSWDVLATDTKTLSTVFAFWQRAMKIRKRTAKRDTKKELWSESCREKKRCPLWIWTSLAALCFHGNN